MKELHGSTQPLSIKSLHSLKVVLKRYGIPFEKEWGRRQAKNIEDLWREIRLEESYLFAIDGHLVRYAKVVCAHILHDRPGKMIDYLIEHKQVFEDGRNRPGHENSSMSEKMKDGETPGGALRRGLKEELRLPPLPARKIGINAKTSFNSRSYPGLHTFRERYWFICMVPDRHFKKEYIEVQKGVKTNHFKWMARKKETCQAYQTHLMSEATHSRSAKKIMRHR